jgi:hypothetical protein
MPGVLSTITTIADDVALVAADAALIYEMFAPPAWKIADSSGKTLLQVDSVVSFDFSQDFEISDYPVEQGGFVSYNKVFRPYQIKMVVAVGGNNLLTNAMDAASAGSFSDAISALTGISARQKFLEQLENAQASTTLYSVYTPEKTFDNVTITHVDYDRNAAKGVTLLSVEIWLEQVSDTATATTSAAQNTKQPQSQDPNNAGAVQGYTPSASVTATVTATPLT